MGVLLLGPPCQEIFGFLSLQGHHVQRMEDKINLSLIKHINPDFVVVYRYRHIITEDIIRFLDGRIVNLHISLLPWNKGADPNLWSFLENTPKGVTLHYVDKGLDTGDIIVQKEINFNDPDATLAETYAQLSESMISLLIEIWPALENGRAPRLPQMAGGSFHRLKDKEPYMHLLQEKGWDTPVRYLIGKALQGSTGNEDR